MIWSLPQRRRGQGGPSAWEAGRSLALGAAGVPIFDVGKVLDLKLDGDRVEERVVGLIGRSGWWALGWAHPHLGSSAADHVAALDRRMAQDMVAGEQERGDGKDEGAWKRASPAVRPIGQTRS